MNLSNKEMAIRILNGGRPFYLLVNNVWESQPILIDTNKRFLIDYAKVSMTHGPFFHGLLVKVVPTKRRLEIIKEYGRKS